MKVLDALVMRCWLSPLAPRLTRHPDAPLASMAADATARLAPMYGGRDVLLAAMAAATRRAAARGLPDLRLYTDPKSLLAATEALHEGEDTFLLAMDTDEPLDRALQIAVDSIGQTTGIGSMLVPHTLRWLPLEAREVVPLIGPAGMDTAAEMLRDWQARLTEGAQAEAGRDLGSLLSLLGRREDAREQFEAVGDMARSLLEDCDESLEAQDWPLAAALATLCVQAAEETEQPTLVAAACRRQSAAAEHQGDLASATHHMRSSLAVARKAQDHRAEAAALEELSRLEADQGRIDTAVAWLGQVWVLQRRQENANGVERALRLAGRLLAESGEIGPGLVMLLAALDLAEVRDPHTAHGIRQYIIGFQYTLSDSEFQALEPLFEAERDPIIAQAFQNAAEKARIH